MAKKCEVLTHRASARFTPHGGTRARSRCVQGQFAVSRPLDNPVMPRGLALLRICMDDRYAWGGLGGEGVAG